MIRNTKCVRHHNLIGIETTDSTQDTKFKQPPQKITRRPKSNYRIKRAFQITLLWCHHIEQQNSLPDLNNEATSYISRHKKERYSTNTRFKCKSAWIISTQTWNRLVGCNAMQPSTCMDKHWSEMIWDKIRCHKRYTCTNYWTSLEVDPSKLWHEDTQGELLLGQDCGIASKRVTAKGQGEGRHKIL